MHALEEAAVLADLIEEGNELLKKAKEVACRIEERCRIAVHSDPNARERPSSGSD